MKQKIILLPVFTCLSLMFFSSCNNKYEGYREIYNSNGTILLVKGNATDSLNKNTNGVAPPNINSTNTIHPEAGRELKDPAAASYMIKKFQRTLPDTSKDTRYIDMYYVNFFNYINKMGSHIGDGTDFSNWGVRIYFAIDSAERNTVVLGPIKNLTPGVTGNSQRVECLWKTQPAKFNAFDFGSLCPDNCTNNGDLTGMD